MVNQTVLSALVAFLVVGLTHLFTGFRDRENKRRGQRIIYLVAAFRALSKASNPPNLHEVASELEQAVADIQLFGTPEEVELIRRFAEDLGSKQEAEMNELLVVLRDNLRRELKGHRSVAG